MLTYRSSLQDCLASNGLECAAVNAILSLSNSIPKDLAKKIFAAGKLINACAAAAAPTFILDADGNIMLDADGNPMPLQ